MRAEAAEPEDSKDASGDGEEPEAHDPIVGAAASRSVEPQ